MLPILPFDYRDPYKPMEQPTTVSAKGSSNKRILLLSGSRGLTAITKFVCFCFLSAVRARDVGATSVRKAAYSQYHFGTNDDVV